MTLWLVRAGGHGEFEERFLHDKRIYLTWGDFTPNLADFKTQEQLRTSLQQHSPDSKAAKVANHSRQIWAFAHRMQIGDWVVLPSKLKPAIHMGEITGKYHFDGSAPRNANHWRTVNWFQIDIPRSRFDQDLLYSFGAFLTICEIKRNNAEKRVHDMAQASWTSTALPSIATKMADDESVAGDFGVQTNLEDLARDQIAQFLGSKFKGHAMARLVEAILKAQGYTTYRSPEGPDHGVDILAAPAPMGFGQPRICVQVKSGDTPLDRPTMDQLIGTMQNVQATQGLLVSWGGFKSSIDREKANQFFRVRLWDQFDLIEQLLDNYDKLDDDLRADLPFKRIWTLAMIEEEET